MTDENFGGRADQGVTAYDLVWAATDHLGSVRQLLDDSQAVVEHREFDAFGNIVGLVDATGTAKDLAALDSVFAFAGREWDNDVALYYNRARWLDARTGRFLSEDPLGFEGGDTNLYRYAGNNPFMLTDSTGMSFLGDLFDDIGDFFSDAFRHIENFVDDYFDNVAEGFKSFIRDPLGGLEYMLKHPGDALEGMATSPLFWVSIVTSYVGVPLFAANTTWGVFDAGIGLGGFSAGPNLFELGREAYSLLSGGGVHIGTPTASMTVLGHTQGVSLASATGLSSQGYATRAGYTEAAAVDRYGLPVSDDPALDAYIEGAISDQSLSSSVWTPYNVNLDDYTANLAFLGEWQWPEPQPMNWLPVSSPAPNQPVSPDQAMLDYHHRVLQQVQLASDALWRGGPATLRDEMPWYSIRNVENDVPGYTGKLSVRVGPDVSMTFPSDWPKLQESVAYTMKNYTKIGYSSVGFTWFGGSSMNFPYWPGISLNRESFYGPERHALTDLLHEPMHDLGWERLGLGIGHRDVIAILPTKWSYGNSVYDRLIDFLQQAKTTNGQSLWTAMQAAAGPRPEGPNP